MVAAPGNTQSTHTLRLKSDASGMVAGLNAVDRELTDVVRQLDRVQAAAGKAGGGINTMNRAAKGAGDGTRYMRNQVQNLGFQVADTAVQLEMGTSALRVFSQQGSQALAVFGAGGAIAGAALSVGVIFAKMALESDRLVVFGD